MLSCDRTINTRVSTWGCDSYHETEHPFSTWASTLGPRAMNSNRPSIPVEPGSTVSDYHVSVCTCLLSSGASPDTWQFFNSPSSCDVGCLTFWCDTWQRRWPRFNRPSLPPSLKGPCYSMFFFLIRARLRETIRAHGWIVRGFFFFFF